MHPRSYLFVPGDSEKKLGKIAGSYADAIIICLEDSVAEANKNTARIITTAFLETFEQDSPQIWVRINPLSTSHALADLCAVMKAKPFGIFLPKPESQKHFEQLDHYLSVLETEHGIEVGSTRIMSLAESAQGTINQYQFAQATPRLQAMTWGAEDMSADIGASTNKDENGNYFLVHQMNRAHCLVTCGAGNLHAVDGICSNFNDEEALIRDCINGRKEGFAGKIAIHPKQVAIINKYFSPSEEEVLYAQRVVDAFANNSSGTVGLDGRMLDLPHLKQAQRTLMQASAL
ncbi:CoA ester lyase [Aestuariicella hydrocarbonica]|uniref:CoA ester lyase n=1 Tax=Pseudomaricurvus hydrocarbonicus TaxID=1470433 RepID=A0A9E5MJ97_9GAMM|nr:CoA ester lyase [Aestuariicella hydrocarbonica]NHO64749.1 CoA ester lyase [Aestuariicella hydrocarbonica]